MAVCYVVSDYMPKQGVITSDMKQLIRGDFKGKKKLVSIGDGNYDKSWFGFDDVEEFSYISQSLSSDEGKYLINEADILLFTGQNSEDQMQLLNNKGYIELLKKFKGIMIGVGTGAVTLGQYSFTAPTSEYPALVMKSMIGRIDYTIAPVFSASLGIDNDLKRVSSINTVLGLTEGAGVRITYHSIKTIGDIYQIKGQDITKFEGKNLRKIKGISINENLKW